MSLLRKWILSVPLLFIICLLASSVEQVTSSSSTSTPSTAATRTESEGIPRSHRRSSVASLSASELSYPPWNPSRHISDRGFLKSLYTRIPGVWERDIRLRTSVTLTDPCQIRQVPGDGNCLFHSISVGLGYVVNGTHVDMKRDLPAVYQRSKELRQEAVTCLRDANRRLCLQGGEWVKSRELVQAAAQQYGLSAEEYCQSMQEESVWGGGPEIVALCNVLKRPIHVYELTTSPNKEHFVLRRMACFGSPRFDRHPALHILSADSRFPDIAPGSQLSDGNHFLAVFPIPEKEDDDENDGSLQKKRKKRKKRLRGGSFFADFWETKGGGMSSTTTQTENNDHDENKEDTVSSKPARKVSERRLQHDILESTKGEEEDDNLEPFQWMGGWWRRRRY